MPPSSNNSNTQRRRSPQQQHYHHHQPRNRRQHNSLLLWSLLAALLLSALQAVLAVNQVYDETGWTKREWHKYKIEIDMHAGPDPAEEVLKTAPALRSHLWESALNSLHGPVKRKAASKFAGMWAREDGSLVASPSEDAVDQAAEAVMCTTCHSLVSHVWGQIVASINHAEPLSESSVKDLVEEACEAHVRHKVLSKYRIVQVEAPELDVSLFVVRERKSVTSTAAAAAAGGSAGGSANKLAQLPDSSSSSDKTSDKATEKSEGSSSKEAKKSDGSADGAAAAAAAVDGSSNSKDSQQQQQQQQGSPLPPMPSDVTPAEIEAVQKACSDLAMHHAASLQKQLWPKAKDYFSQRLTLAQTVLTKAQWYNDDSFWEPDAYEDPDDEDDLEDDSEDEDEDDDKDAAAGVTSTPSSSSSTPSKSKQGSAAHKKKKSSDSDSAASSSSWSSTSGAAGPDTSLSMDSIKLKAAQKLVPADQLCLDMDIMCPYWAQQGQCTANPKYMVGDRRHMGHCKASCDVCQPKSIWKKHPLVKQELRKSAAAAGQLLRTSACSASRACMTGGTTIGSLAAVKESGSLLPGAVLAKTPGFVLGKPFWGTPIVTNNDNGGLSVHERTTDTSKQDVADETLLSAGLGSKKVAIPGMDNYFMYQLEYKKRVYQYAKDKETGKIKEEHVLGLFDPTATETAARRDALALAAASASASAAAAGGRGGAKHASVDAAKAWQAQWKLQQQQQQKQKEDSSQHRGSKGSAGGGGGDGDSVVPPAAPPMLELLDYLPDRESMITAHWPYMRQMYTRGETCHVEGKSVERQVELRAVCSPDGALHMLVREPSFCQYIMVLYHPQLCEVDRLKPVPVLASSSSSSGSGSGSGSSESSKKGGGDGQPGSEAASTKATSAKAAADSPAGPSKPTTSSSSSNSGSGGGGAARGKAAQPPAEEVRKKGSKGGDDESSERGKLSTS